MRKLAIAAMILAACTTNQPMPTSPTPMSEPVTPPPSAAYAPGEPRVATIDSRAPLVTIRVMVTHGSTSDPAGKEGLASLTADMITDGSYRDAPASSRKNSSRR